MVMSYLLPPTLDERTWQTPNHDAIDSRPCYPAFWKLCSAVVIFDAQLSVFAKSRAGFVASRFHGTGTEIRYQDPSALPWSKMAMATTGKDVYTAISTLSHWVFHVFDAGYRAIVSYCFYVIPESVIEFDKTAVNWCTKNTEDLGNSSVRSW